MVKHKLLFAESPKSYLTNQTHLFSDDEKDKMDSRIADLLKRGFVCHVFEYVESFKAETEIKKFTA